MDVYLEALKRIARENWLFALVLVLAWFCAWDWI